MEKLKKKLSRTRSSDSTTSALPAGAKGRGRRGGLTPFNFRKSSAFKELQQALKTGDVTRLRELLDGGAELEDIEEVQKALRQACERGLVDVLTTLIRHGASVNGFEESSPVAPLHVCARHGMVSAMNVLLSHGAKLNILTKFERRTVLHVAAISGKEDAITFLLEADSSGLLDRADIYGSTPVHLAVKMGHKDIVKLLLQHRARFDVNAYDNEGWTALHLAAEDGDTDMAQILIDHHAQIDSQTKYGRSPLHWAVRKNHVLMVRMLLEHKASVTLRDLHGKSSLDYCKDASLKQLLKSSDSVLYGSSPTESTIGSYLKIDPRESFIRRLPHPLPHNVNAPVMAPDGKRRSEPGPDNLDTIAEESEVTSLSTQSSFRSEQGTGEGPKDKISFVRALFQTKGSSSDGQSARSEPSSRTNSIHSSRSDLEASIKSTTSSARLIQALENGVCVDFFASTPSLAQSESNIANTTEIVDDDACGALPEEALMGRAQLRAMMGRIRRHQNSVESVLSALSTDLTQATAIAAGAHKARKNTTNNNNNNNPLASIASRLHKLKDMMHDFREENERQAELITNSMGTFLDTIKKRLSSRDPLPLWIHHAFLHAAASYLATLQNAWRQLIQKLSGVSEERRSDVLNMASQLPTESSFERCSLAIQFAFSALPCCQKDTPLKALLLLITQCALEPNSAQIIIKKFIEIVRTDSSEPLSHDSLTTLSYRLGTDGEPLCEHLGLSRARGAAVGLAPDSGDPMGEPLSPCQLQERNLSLVSRWRQATVRATPQDNVYELVEGLIVIGREDLLVWVLCGKDGADGGYTQS